MLRHAFQMCSFEMLLWIDDKAVWCRRAVLAESRSYWTFSVNEWKSGAGAEESFLRKAENLKLLLWMNEKQYGAKEPF